MKNKAIITVLLCIVTIQLKAQNPEQVVREYISALNEWLASPTDTEKQEIVESFFLQNADSACTMKDEIVEKYNDAGSMRTNTNNYLSILRSKSSKRKITIQIVYTSNSSDNEINSANAWLKYSGGVKLKTVSEFWIYNGKIGYISHNEKESIKWRNNSYNENFEINEPNNTSTQNPNHSDIYQPVTSNKVNQKDNTYEMLIKDQNYMEGLGAYYSRDYQTAFKKWMICANQNNITAQRLIGYCYFKGLGVEQSIKNAKIWYKKAADAGDIYAEEYCRILLENYN